MDEVTKGNVKHSPQIMSKHVLLPTQQQMCNVLHSNADITGLNLTPSVYVMQLYSSKKKK